MNKKKGFRKILAGILAVTMIVTSVPTSVYADEEIPADAVSEERTIGSSDSSNEPITLKNNTGSDISFVAATRKEDAENENAVTNALQNDEVIAADETVKFYADFVESGDYVLIIKCNGNTYYINTFDYFATDLSKEVSIENDKDNNVLYLKGTKRDGSSFDSLNAELEYIKAADMAEAEEVESIETSEETTEAVTEEVTEEVTEKAVETVTEETTEAASEEKAEEVTEEAEKEASAEKESSDTDAEEISQIDASKLQYRLLVATDSEEILTSGYVISGYEGVYLIGYETESERTVGYDYYQDKAIFVEFDDEIYEIAENDSTQTDATESSEAEVINQDDALTVLSDLNESEIKDDKKVIALIDTGANSKVTDSVSVIGEDTADDNGHGSLMIDTILEENPNAKILSIKAFDSNGKAKPSDIYAAVRYAIDNKVSIINMSFSAFSTEDNSIVKDIIEEAIDNGIIVVGAAGNKGKDIKYFIPGNIDEAIIVGAIDKDKKFLATNNTGATLDYLTYGDSSSEATARFTGILSKTGLNNIEKNEKIFRHEYKEVTEEELKEDNSDIEWLHQDWNTSSDFETNTIVAGTDWPSQVTLYGVEMTGENYANVLHDNWYNPATGTGPYYRGTELYWTYTGWSLPEGYDKANYNIFKGMAFCTRAGATAPLGYSRAVFFDIATNESTGDYAWYYAAGIRMIDNNAYQTIGAKVKLQYTGGSEIYIGLKKSSASALNPSMDGIVYDIVDTSHNVFWTVTLGSTGEIKSATASRNRMNISADDYFEFRGIVTDANGKAYLHIHRGKSGGTWDNAFQLHERTTNANYKLNTSYDPIPGINNGGYLTLTADVCPSLKEEIIPYPPVGMVQVFKVDDSGNPMKNVRFSLYNTKADADSRINAVETKGTSDYGIVNFVGLSAGTYYIRETGSIDGYKVDDKTYAVTVSLNNTFGVGGQSYGYVFDSTYYSSNHSDLNRIYGNDKDKLAGHFSNYGMNEGRRASDNFNLSVYRATYDVNGVFDGNTACENWSNRDYYIHYLNSGAKEGRLARALSEYKSMSLGVNQNNTPVVVVKVENTKMKDYYIAIKKEDNAGNAMVGVTFDLSYKDNDANVTRTLKPSYNNDTNTYRGIWSGFDARVNASTEIIGHTRNATNGLAVIYLGKFAKAPTDIKVTENWISAGSNSAFANGKALLYKGATATAVYKSDYVTTSQSFNVTAYNSEAEAKSHAFTFKNTPKKYSIGIYKKDPSGKAVRATFDIYGTNTANATSGGTLVYSDRTTNTSTGKFSIDVTNIYNSTSTNISGKYRYFYAIEKSCVDHDVIESQKTKVVTVHETTGSALADADYVTYTNPESVYLTIIKKSKNPTCTDGNPNYSLAGIKYGVYKNDADANADIDGSKALHLFTIRADGTTTAWHIPSEYMNINNNTMAYRNTTFSIKEFNGGKGYEINPVPGRVTVTAANTSSNPAKYETEDNPIMDPVQITISKVDIDGNPVAEGAGNLEGAQFVIKYYAVDINNTYTVEQLAQRSANATWTIQTKYESTSKTYRAKLDTGWLVSGANNSPFYYEDGNPDPMMPDGYITIEEIKAPNGYTTEDSVYRWSNNSTSNNNIAIAKIDSANNNNRLIVGNTAVSGDITEIEKPIRGNFELLKTDKDNRPMANVEFEIKSETTGESYTIKTGADGKYNSETAGLWFGKKTDGSETVKIDGLGALPVGDYTVTELRCDANKGYQLQPTIRFTVSEAITYVVKDGKVTEDAIYNVKNPEITTTASVTETGTKLAPQNSNVTIKDTVSYSNLKVDTDFIAVGRLMVVNEDGTSYVYQKDGKDYIVTKPVKTGADYTKSVYEATDKFDVEFTVDTTDLDGKKLVVVEKLYLGTTVPTDDASAAQYPGTTDKIFPVIHENLDDNNQTIIIPKVITQAYKTGDTANKTISAVANASVTDTITYTNLDPSLSYSVKSSLIDKANGNVFKDATGKEVTVTNNSFKPTASDGTHDVTFTFDATGMEGKTLVVFEEISYNNKVVASHTVLTDIAQTVYVPSLKSQVKDNKTNDQMTLAEKNASITDTIEYSNLTPGTEYVVKGTMMDKAAKTALKDSSGNTVTVSVPFIPTAVSGKQDVTFTFDASGLEGKTIVAFQDIYLGNTIVASENDYEQTSQTIYIPSGQTEAKDSETNERMSNADKTVTINDTVSYKNLIPGKKYTTVGQLVNKKTGKPLEINGKAITNTVEFTADKPDGTMIVPFTFDASALEGETVVVFEDVYYNDIPVIIHHDINDEDQSPKFPKVRTTVSDDKTADHVTLAEKSASFTDTVTYENVLVGKKYKVTGTLMNKATKSALLDADGKEIKVSSEPFTASSENGTVKVKFTFDASLLEGATIVVYEELILIGDEEKVVGTHKDIEDKEQTIYIPKAGTTAKDLKTNDQITLAEKDATVIDTVKYENLLAGKTYKVTGKLYDKETEKPFLINGKEITKTVEFTPTEPDGTIDVEFVFDASALEGKTVVVFEDISLNGKLIAVHHDIKDTKQTIYIPKGKTTVKDDKTGDKITYAEKEASITDTMSYNNLIPGKEYVLTGKLMDKSTNKPVLDKDGAEIVNSTPFTPAEPDGSVELTFKFDSSLLKGKKIVVFEDVTYEGKSVIIEHNINDEEQTTRIPDGHTTVKDTKTEDHITFASEEAEIIDTVFYENLIPNKEYTLTGYLMDKATKEPVLDKNGNKITNTAKFTPAKESGTTDISFKFNSEVLKGQKIVVFEDVYYNEKLVFTHHDIDDVDQTTSIPKGHTVLLDDKTKEHLTLAEEKASVTDTIYYEGLIVGKAYTATGVLMDKETEKPILDAEGNEITNTVSFTAETESGIIKVPFTFDAMLLKGKQVVVFEDVYFDNKEVFIHHDINDEEQTTWIPDGHTTAKDAKTGDHITLAEEDAHIDDTITYKNLIADGRTYTATGVLMDKATGEAVLDKNGNEITNTVTFVPEKADGEVVVPFDFDASILKGQKIVVFEDVRYGGKDVFIHHELNDVDQTTTIPGGSTQAKDTKTYTNMALAEPQTTIFDFILYEGLIADGREYEATGVLMDQETGNPLLDKNGKEITNTVTFKPEKESGYITVPFTFDSSLLKGKTIVVFEDVYWDKKAVFIHHDITDKPQTVVFPEVLTTATLKNGGKTVTAGDEVTVVDEVLINNILKDEEYIVKGKLMNKSTGKPFTVGGKELTAEKSFKAEDTKTVITTEFTFSTKGIDKIDLVVFEELYVVREINGKKTEVLVADHADLNDKNQTVNIITVPKTGDTSPVLPIAGVCMAALLGIGVVMYKKKKRREE